MLKNKVTIEIYFKKIISSLFFLQKKTHFEKKKIVGELRIHRFSVLQGLPLNGTTVVQTHDDSVFVGLQTGLLRLPISAIDDPIGKWQVMRGGRWLPGGNVSVVVFICILFFSKKKSCIFYKEKKFFFSKKKHFFFF